jgi:hypothetical protein
MKHRLSRGRISLLFILPSVVTIGMVAGIWYGAPFVVILVSIAFAALAWYGYMTVPFEFELHPDDVVSFRSTCRTLNIPISDITEIDARPWNSGFVFFRHSHGKAALFRSTPGMKDLIKSVQNHNPSIILKGGV